MLVHLQGGGAGLVDPLLVILYLFKTFGDKRDSRGCLYISQGSVYTVTNEWPNAEGNHP